MYIELLAAIISGLFVHGRAQQHLTYGADRFEALSSGLQYLYDDYFEDTLMTTLTTNNGHYAMGGTWHTFKRVERGRLIIFEESGGGCITHIAMYIHHANTVAARSTRLHIVADSLSVVNGTMENTARSPMFHRANRPDSLMSWAPICYSRSLEIWVTRSGAESAFPEGLWQLEKTCVGLNKKCTDPFSNLVYYVHLERRAPQLATAKEKTLPESSQSAYNVDAPRILETFRSRPFASISIASRARIAWETQHFEGRVLGPTLSGKAVFTFKGTHLSSAESHFENVIDGLFVRVLDTTSICNLNLAIQFDDVSPLHVPSMPLDMFCGRGDRETSQGPMAIGWEKNLSICVVSFPMPFRSSARLTISTTASTATEVQVFANVSSYVPGRAGRFQYFSAQYRESSASEACHGPRTHSVAHVSNDGTSGKLVGVHWYSDLHPHSYEGNHIIQWDNLRGSGYFGTGLEDFFYLYGYFAPDGTDQKGAFAGAIAETRRCSPSTYPNLHQVCPSSLHPCGCGFDSWKEAAWFENFEARGLNRSAESCAFGKRKGVGNSAYRHFVLDPIIFHDGLHYFVQLSQTHAISKLLRPLQQQCDAMTSGVKSVAFLYLDVHQRYIVQDAPLSTVPSQEIVTASQSGNRMLSNLSSRPQVTERCHAANRAVKSTYHEDVSRVATSISYRIVPHGCCDVVTIPEEVRAGSREHSRIRRGFLSSFLGTQIASVHIDFGHGLVHAGTWSTAILRNPYEELAEDEYILQHDMAPTEVHRVAICPIQGSAWVRSSYQISWRPLAVTAARAFSRPTPSPHPFCKWSMLRGSAVMEEIRSAIPEAQKLHDHYSLEPASLSAFDTLVGEGQAAGAASGAAVGFRAAQGCYLQRPGKFILLLGDSNDRMILHKVCDEHRATVTEDPKRGFHRCTLKNGTRLLFAPIIGGRPTGPYHM